MFEGWLCKGIIPLALLLSAAGLVSSVSTLIRGKHPASWFRGWTRGGEMRNSTRLWA